jgi:hypothetical protein
MSEFTLFDTDSLYLSIDKIEITPNTNYAIVRLWHSIYQEHLISATVIFEELKIKPIVMFNVKLPYELDMFLHNKLEKLVVKVLRDTWGWGRKIGVSNG